MSIMVPLWLAIIYGPACMVAGAAFYRHGFLTEWRKGQ